VRGSKIGINVVEFAFAPSSFRLEFEEFTRGAIYAGLPTRQF
jgi:hypothetical protein